jgi:hypothetical protein
MPTDCGVIDAREADVIGRIWEGPRRRDGSSLWNGIDRAALIHAPQPPPANQASPFSDGRAPDPASLSLAAFETQFNQFVERYGGVMDTSSPVVGAFARHGKTILWHGVADDIIPARGTVHYVNSIRRTLGERETDAFLRFYIAPGVGHCGGGDGPQPVALLEPLMEWVEHDRAPEAVRSENRDETGHITRTRPLCPYPALARYRGHGALNDGASFQCQL